MGGKRGVRMHGTELYLRSDFFEIFTVNYDSSH